MPLKLDFAFRDTPNDAIFELPLKGGEPDIEITRAFLKVNQPPYLLALDLHDDVKYADAEVVIDRAARRLRIRLPKSAPRAWPGAAAVGANPEELAARREAAAREKQEAASKAASDVKAKRAELERDTLKKQMGLEEAQRRLLEERQAAEKAAAEAEVFKAFSTMQATQADSSGSAGSSGVAAAAPPAGEEAAEGGAAATTAPAAPPTAGPAASAPTRPAVTPVLPPPRSLPPPRTSAAAAAAAPVVGVSFTPRVFPTPLRASKRDEEEAWVSKNWERLQQERAKRSAEEAAKNSSPDGVSFKDKDPLWLKGRGDELFKVGDFRSALNAYTAAIDAPAGLRSGFKEAVFGARMNRSACYLQLGRYPECSADCVACMKELAETSPPSTWATPSGPSPAGKQYAKCMLRLTLSSARSGDPGLALQTLDVGGSNPSAPGSASGNASALAWLGDPALLELRAQLQALVAAAEHKKRGDELAASGADNALADARRAYETALSLYPRLLPARLNLASVALALGDAAGCVANVTAALSLLGVADDGTELPASSSSPYSIDAFPPPGSRSRHTLVRKALMKRGAGHVAAGDAKAALADYKAALALPLPEGGSSVDEAADPLVATLRADVAALEALVAEQQ